MSPVTSSAANAQSDALRKKYSDAMTAFQGGKWDESIKELGEIIQAVHPNPASPVEGVYEPLFYSYAAACFNLPDYVKALAAFTEFKQKFPNSTRIADVTLALAQCNALMEPKNLAESIKLFASLENIPSLHEQVVLAEANVLKLDGKTDEAIAKYEQMTGTGINTIPVCTGAITLAQLYVEKGEREKASALLEKIRQKQYLVANTLEFNRLLMSLGDRMADAEDYKTALNCYRFVMSREEILASQDQRIAMLKKQYDDALPASRLAGPRHDEAVARVNDLQNKIKDANAVAEAYGKMPDFRMGLLFRYARCYTEMKKTWETIVIYNELLALPGSPNREPALYGLITALISIGRMELAQKDCEVYLKEFPQGPNAGAVGYLMGATAAQSGDTEKAEKYFERVLAEQPDNKFKDKMEFLLGNAKFMQGKFQEAIAGYKKYVTDYPQGENVEEANYRISLSQLFCGNYQEAMEMFTEYVQKYPGGFFAPDARYRLAVCNFALQQYDKVRTDCESWEKDYPDNSQLGEILALEADVYATPEVDQMDKAIELYLRSYHVAKTAEVLNYSLFEATKHLQKEGKWEEISRVFEEFVRENPDNPSTVSALFWIGKAKARTGQPEEAKKFFAGTILKYIDDSSREPVDRILTQLAVLCAKKTGPASGVSPGGKEVDPGAELDQLLGAAGADQTATARARILFAKAELARLRRQPQERENNLNAIADKFQPEDLSAQILGQVGDYLLSKGEADKASQFYEQLRNEFPKSDYLDFAYAGLGEIAYQKKDYKTALSFFTDGTDKIAANIKLKDVTVGRAKTLLEMNQLDEARKLFEQVASMREWRGDATAQSLYSLGQIQMKENKLPEAIAYFQRVFVTYQKFVPWVAKSYIKSGECFEKLGKTQEALNTYHEMLRIPKLQQLPEAETARQRLKELGEV